MVLNLTLLGFFVLLIFFSYVNSSRCFIGIIGVILSFLKVSFASTIIIVGLGAIILESLKFMNEEYSIQSKSETQKSILPYLYAITIITVSVIFTVLLW
jgi:uncharacterized membrane protein YidH (DUF202 family)